MPPWVGFTLYVLGLLSGFFLAGSIGLFFPPRKPRLPAADLLRKWQTSVNPSESIKIKS